MEWHGEQELLCRECGHPRDETMRDDDDPDRPRWKAEAAVCAVCEETAKASRAAHADAEGDPLDGWKWGATRLPARNGRG